jgi:hypothetical protein
MASVRKCLRVLVGCEFSGVVREAFAGLGHEAWSCDFLPSDQPGRHLQCDVLDVLDRDWDIALFFPPCTYLCSSGMHWTTRGFRDPQLTEDALDFVRRLLGAPIPRIVLENPVGCISTRIRKPDQIIQPFEYGDPFRKTTCLWLKNLPKLRPTNIVSGREQKCWFEPPSPDRWKKRSQTYNGIAQAMALQWSGPDPVPETKI